MNISDTFVIRSTGTTGGTFRCCGEMFSGVQSNRRCQDNKKKNDVGEKAKWGVTRRGRYCCGPGAEIRRWMDIRAENKVSNSCRGEHQHLGAGGIMSITS